MSQGVHVSRPQKRNLLAVFTKLEQHHIRLDQYENTSDWLFMGAWPEGSNGFQKSFEMVTMTCINSFIPKVALPTNSHSLWWLCPRPATNLQSWVRYGMDIETALKIEGTKRWETHLTIKLEYSRFTKESWGYRLSMLVSEWCTKMMSPGNNVVSCCFSRTTTWIMWQCFGASISMCLWQDAFAMPCKTTSEK